MDLGRPLESYVTEVLSRTSVAAERKLNAAAHGTLSFKNFDDASIDLKVFDWQTGPGNRNWWWQLQQFPFLRWYVQAVYVVSQSEYHDSLLEFIYLSVMNWQVCEKKYRGKSPLMWHDHATALRLKYMTDMYVAIFGVNVECQGLKDLLAFEIQRHATWLSQDKNYSRRTNHGFEQADILLRTTLVFPECNKFFQAGKISKERLVDEVSFAFTEQGVHKENSPAYHQVMLEKLKTLTEYKKLGEEELSVLGENLIGKARIFLNAITLPDGTLPLIGDTQKEVAKKVNLASLDDVPDVPERAGCKLWDYSDSGYVVVEYIDEGTGQTAKLIVRSGQFSHYHRHDDDLSIYWQIGGHLILGDGGLYSYDEKDSCRRFFRSKNAHSTAYVVDEDAVRDLRNIPRRGSICLKENPERVIAETHCYKGWRIRRVINLENLVKGRLVVEDQSYSDDLQGVAATNWFFPTESSRLDSIEKNSCDVSFESGVKLRISSSSLSSGCAIYRGWEGRVDNGAISSEKFGAYSSAARFVVYWPAPGVNKTCLQVVF